MFRSRIRAVREEQDPDRHPGYRVAMHGPFDLVDVGDLELDAGGRLVRAELGVVTLGALNARADNAVLVTTWYGGSHAPIVRTLVGPGRAIDPADHFVIIANQLGNGFSTSSIDPGRTGARLPPLSIADDVVAQERLVRDVFGIDRLALVLGCSMGAMQALEWGTRFPDRVDRIVAVAGTASPTPSTRLLVAAIRRSLEHARDEPPGAALQRHAGLWALFGYSRAFWDGDGWAALGFDSSARFVAEGFEPLMLARSVAVLDALADKWSRAGRYADGSSIALERIRARTVLVPVGHDAVFPLEDVRRDADRIPGARVEPVETEIGHLAILGLTDGYRRQLDRIVARALSS